MRVQQIDKNSFCAVHKMNVFVNGKKINNRGLVKRVGNNLAKILVGPNNSPDNIEIMDKYAKLAPNDYGYEKTDLGYVMDKSYMFDNVDEKPTSIFTTFINKHKNIAFFVSGDEANDYVLMEEQIEKRLYTNKMEEGKLFKSTQIYNLKGSIIKSLKKMLRHKVPNDCLNVYVDNNENIKKIVKGSLSEIQIADIIKILTTRR